MKNLFDATVANQVKGRAAQLGAAKPETLGQDDRCADARTLLGKHAVGGRRGAPRYDCAALTPDGAAHKADGVSQNSGPIRRNSPTAESLLVADDRDFSEERERLLGLIDRFLAGGPVPLGLGADGHTEVSGKPVNVFGLENPFVGYADFRLRNQSDAQGIGDLIRLHLQHPRHVPQQKMFLLHLENLLLIYVVSRHRFREENQKKAPPAHAFTNPSSENGGLPHPQPARS